MLSKVVRVSKKNTIYIPKDIAEKVGVSEGILVEVSVEDGKIVLTPIPCGWPFTDLSSQKCPSKTSRGLARRCRKGS
jgi:AbrB family looped-hinge helix DNA binding protein